LNAQGIADIAEKRFVQIIKKDLGAIQVVPYYYNLISWLIKQVRLLPQTLTEAEKCETIENSGDIRYAHSKYDGDILDSRYNSGYNDDRLLGC